MYPNNGLSVIKEEAKIGTGTKKGKSNAAKKLNKSCRICLCEENENKDDPIVSPCMCKGYSGDIHIKCLQEWLNQKRKVTKLSSF